MTVQFVAVYVNNANGRFAVVRTTDAPMSELLYTVEVGGIKSGSQQCPRYVFGEQEARDEALFATH